MQHCSDFQLLCFSIKGVLKGFDQATNIILVESHERTRLFYQGMNSILHLFNFRSWLVLIIAKLGVFDDESILIVHGIVC